jgi:SAM-dependent methyltransferase
MQEQPRPTPAATRAPDEAPPGGSVLAAIRRSAERLAERPETFHWLRKLPEWNSRATKRQIARVRAQLGSPDVLDCGSGTGEFAPLFDPERYLGVDIHPGYVAFAQRRHPHHRFAVADLSRWGGDGRRFDLVLVNGVLHHLDDGDARAVLDTAVRQLAPGGSLLVIEDVRLPRAGLVTRLVHWLDYGRHIRDTAAWRALVGQVLPIERCETYTSGWCPYQLMLCRAP